MRYRYPDDSDSDSAAPSSIADFQEWRTIMAEAKRDRDAQLSDDQPYPPAVGPESPLQHVAQRSSNSEIDEADEDEQRSTTFQ